MLHAALISFPSVDFFGSTPRMLRRHMAWDRREPRLLDVDCKTVGHMRLANALCRFVEIAEEQN